MNYLRNLLLTLTAAGAVLSFYIKICRDFYMETIKLKYKNVPGKQSFLEIITVGVICSSIIIDIIMGVVAIMTKGNIFYENISSSMYENKFIYWRDWVLTMFLFNSMACIFVESFRIKHNFINKLEVKGKAKLMKERMGWVYASIFTSLTVFLYSVYIILYNFIQKISLLKEERNFIFVNALSIDDVKNLIVWGIMSFISLTFFIILTSMREIAKTINQNFTYIILTETEEIACNSYLEYNEYYLVFRNGVQRYISKSKVKEINKSTYYYRQNLYLKI